ncbi:MAG: LemA family protein [Gammaproteobacteria bacterium]
MTLWLGIPVAAVLLWAIVIYNLLVRDRARVDAAWSDIDVQLRRRADLLPKLVDTVRQHASYEAETLAEAIRQRDPEAIPSEPIRRALREGRVERAIDQVFARVEDYPELNASAAFVHLQEQISEVERHIQHARRYYNGAVRNLNTRLEQFPDMLLARLLRYSARPYFQVDRE